jgi:hypothetical protein
MNDTSPEIERFVRERYASMTGEERFVIGARMFDTAREIVLASLPKNLPPMARRQALIRRIYPELGEAIASRVGEQADRASAHWR